MTVDKITEETGKLYGFRDAGGFIIGNLFVPNGAAPNAGCGKIKFERGSQKYIS